MLAPNEPTAASVFRPRTTIDADGTVEGYASLFGEIDAARDMVMPGAFRETLKLRGPRRIPMLFQHDPSEPIGIWLELVEDFRGLKARGRLIPEVARARELLALVKAGAVDGLSIGFRTVKGRLDPRTRVRKLDTVDLWEISIVTFPLLAGARVRAVKESPVSLPAVLLRAGARRAGMEVDVGRGRGGGCRAREEYCGRHTRRAAERSARNRAHAATHTAAAEAHPGMDQRQRYALQS